MKKLIAKFMQDESGASLIEYVLIAGLISIAGWALDAVAGNRDGERSRRQPTSNQVIPDTRSSGTSGHFRGPWIRAGWSRPSRPR